MANAVGTATGGALAGVLIGLSLAVLRGGSEPRRGRRGRAARKETLPQSI